MVSLDRVHLPWQGSDCTKELCPKECSGNGFCTDSGCACYPHYKVCMRATATSRPPVYRPRLLAPPTELLPTDPPAPPGRGVRALRLPERLLRPRHVQRGQVRVREGVRGRRLLERALGRAKV